MDREVDFRTQIVLVEDRGCGESTSLKDHAASKQPEKRQTRQWAAWTQQEEENFFTALRQVGKNFEKITCSVQSKNKDQVRHYYYRLVRRMNRLLRPELCLDAKNSKDTNSAMLRWWSLLEKYSCKASKLHLKPRRFKIFVETLEHQLLKDRKKKRKRKSTGKNCSSTPPLIVTNQDRALGNDANTVKLVFVGNQNMRKFGSRKGSSLRRSADMGVSPNSFKGDPSPLKATKCWRKPGTAGGLKATASSAAYRRWEKAAIAGVSLVADAAEHLERTAVVRFVENVQNMQGEKYLDPVAKDKPHVPILQKNMFAENNAQASMKLKLQLFPVDEGTRRALEMNNHNPHLELTLSTRKKISSVLEHLGRKWGNSSIASGELALLPYFARLENLESSQKWTQDSFVSAADVYALIGNPPLFRLRYGWFSNAQSVFAPCQAPLASCGPIKGPAVPMEEEGSCKVSPFSPVEWADSLTNISVGELLCEVSHNDDANCVDSPQLGTSQCLQQIPFSCDSFDAAIAAHICKNQSKAALQPTLASSIWDAEETCDAFSFQRNPICHEKVESCSTSLIAYGVVGEELPGMKGPVENDPSNGDPLEESQFDPHAMDSSGRDINGFTDIYWPDSLGPLDLDVPSCRYHNEELILSDSLGGLNRLINSSLDAFQTCFFGLDHKELPSSVGPRPTAPFSDYKISSEV